MIRTVIGTSFYHRNYVRDLQFAPNVNSPGGMHRQTKQYRVLPSRPTPPPTPSTNNNKWPWRGLTALVIAGFGIVCAQRSPETRDWLTLYAPWLDDIIAILYQENMSYIEFAAQSMTELKDYIDQFNVTPQNQSCPEKKPISDVPRKS